jgi:hypothetical protein
MLRLRRLAEADLIDGDDAEARVEESVPTGSSIGLGRRQVHVSHAHRRNSVEVTPALCVFDQPLSQNSESPISADGLIIDGAVQRAIVRP